MTTSKSLMDLQLKEMGQLTGVSWAVWLERVADWDIHASFKLTGSLRSTLLKYIHQPSIRTWLNGSLSGSRSRPRAAGPEAGLGCGKLYIFPDQMTQRVILVGCSGLSSTAQRFWGAIALGSRERQLLDLSGAPGPVPAGLNIPYYLPEALDRILESALRIVPCQGGWLAIRSGDHFEIKAHSNCEECSDVRLAIEPNPLLRQITQNQQARLVKKGEDSWAMVPRLGLSAKSRAWSALPLLIGKRLIGLLVLWAEAPYKPEEWTSLKQLASQVAPSVEVSVTFADLTQHLHRLALLNDFAMTVSSALEPEQIAQRIFALLQRAFGTERIILTILSTDGSSVQRYLDRDGSIVLKTASPEETPILWPVEQGQVYRVDTILPKGEYQPAYLGSRSALVIPLKYRRQLIGALGLESSKEGAFTVYDEHLLVVIASHLAGLLENGRLRSEAEERARNLSLIHEVVQQVIGLTDLRQVAQIAAELMARNFAYELAVVVLVEGPEQKLTVAGIGGSVADIVQQGLHFMDRAREDGIVRRVTSTGQSLLVNDVARNPLYKPIPDWNAGSEMCVALKEGELILGAIDVESRRRNAFSHNDFIVLESLAGILSNVISGVGQFQRLQATVDQLRAAREELQQRIAAQRSAESRLVQAAKLAAVGEMAAGIAHELNNPLTTVSGFAELVLEELTPESGVREDLELVLREANRARSVVRRLLDFARQTESARTRSDMNELVTDVLALVSHLLHTSGIQSFTGLASGTPWVSVDRNQIKQVILNLIHNALHAMPEGGELYVATACRQRERRQWLTISVRDTGTGISPANLERIFEPFFTTRSNDGGTGLGLSVSYGIVADHGGFIDVESQIGKGSTFTVWLPVEAE